MTDTLVEHKAFLDKVIGHKDSLLGPEFQKGKAVLTVSELTNCSVIDRYKVDKMIVGHDN